MHSRGLAESQEKLEGILLNLPDRRCHTIKKGEEIGAWLSVLPSTVNGTELSTQEFRNALFRRYGIAPPV
jgi:hypothetical protein